MNHVEPFVSHALAAHNVDRWNAGSAPRCIPVASVADPGLHKTAHIPACAVPAYDSRPIRQSTPFPFPIPATTLGCHGLRSRLAHVLRASARTDDALEGARIAPGPVAPAGHRAAGCPGPHAMLKAHRGAWASGASKQLGNTARQRTCAVTFSRLAPDWHRPPSNLHTLARELSSDCLRVPSLPTTRSSSPWRIRDFFSLPPYHLSF